MSEARIVEMIEKHQHPPSAAPKFDVFPIVAWVAVLATVLCCLTLVVTVGGSILVVAAALLVVYAIVKLLSWVYRSLAHALRSWE